MHASKLITRTFPIFALFAFASLISAARGEFDGGNVTGGKVAADSSSRALKVLNVVPDTPLRYEKRNGRLEVRALITLSKAPEGAVSLALDGKPLACEAGPKPKTLCAWLPFVGGESRLDVIQDGRVASSFRTAAPIDGDWGYFANGEICMIQSSHQDIAWMDTPDYCRRRVDGHTRLLPQGPD